MIRTLYVIVCTVLLTVVLGVGVISASVLDKTGEWPQKIIRLWGRSILSASRIKVSVKDQSNRDPCAPYIFMSNHQSNFDIPVIQAHLCSHFKWLAKAELFKIPFFGLVMRRAAYISIDRSDRESAIQSLQGAAHIIKGGVSVLIFPEGTRSRDGKISAFKKGGFFLAVDSGVPIIPVIIHGTGSIMPKNKLRIRPGNVVMEIAKPIETAGYTRETKDELISAVRQVMCSRFEMGIEDASSC